MQSNNRKLKLWELERDSVESFKQKEKFPIIVVLDDIRSLNNVGTFFRTCDAFNIEKLILCGITGKPPHREIQKTAIGATESMEWEYCEDVISAVTNLKKSGYVINSIEQTENSLLLNEFDGDSKNRKQVLVFGNEVDGVNQEVIDISDYVIEIPQFGTKHSLNVSVCAGIIMWKFIENLEL